MLELPSSTASAPKPFQAGGAASRQVEPQDKGFHGRLRDALGGGDDQKHSSIGDPGPSRPQLPASGQEKDALPPRSERLREAEEATSTVPPSVQDAASAEAEGQVHAESLNIGVLGAVQPFLTPPSSGIAFEGDASSLEGGVLLRQSVKPDLLGLAEPHPPAGLNAADAKGASAVSSQLMFNGAGSGTEALVEGQPSKQPVVQGQAVQPAMVQQGDPKLAAPEQQAVIASLGTALSQKTNLQVGKPNQPGQATENTHEAAPIEAIGAAKAAMEGALLTREGGILGAAEEAAAALVLAARKASPEMSELEAPKKVVIGNVVQNESHIISGQGFGLAVTDGALSRAEAALPSASARESPPSPPIRQVAPVLVSLALGGGNEALTIMLDPGELGRVEVSIGQGKDLGQVRIIAERPETLALLQRDQRELDRALTQAGLGDMARSLSFSLSSDQGRQQHQHAAQDGTNRLAAQSAGQETDRSKPPPMPAPLRASTSLIDLAI